MQWRLRGTQSEGYSRLKGRFTSCCTSLSPSSVSTMPINTAQALSWQDRACQCIARAQLTALLLRITSKSAHHPSTSQQSIVLAGAQNLMEISIVPTRFPQVLSPKQWSGELVIYLSLGMYVKLRHWLDVTDYHIYRLYNVRIKSYIYLHIRDETSTASSHFKGRRCGPLYDAAASTLLIAA